MSLYIFLAAAGFTSTGLVWLGWKHHKNTQASGYSNLAVDEALNDGCIRAISGCFEQEQKVKAPNDGVQVISGYSEQEQKAEGLIDSGILAVAGHRI